MVILITGASHTGKTLLSQSLLEKYSDKSIIVFAGREEADAFIKD